MRLDVDSSSFFNPSSKDFDIHVVEIIPATATAAPDASTAAETADRTDGAVGDPVRTPVSTPAGERTPVSTPTGRTPVGTPTGERTPPTPPTPTTTSAAEPTPATVTGAAPTPTPTLTPTPQAPAAPATGCASPNVELTRHGNTSCVTEAVCLSAGFGWTPKDGKCVGPPPCATGYAYDQAGICRTPKYNCPHPQLDYDHIPPCTTRPECAPVSEGYTISGTDCVYTVTCETGYTYDSGFDLCVTPYGCPYPDLDFAFDPFCISPTDCAPASAGYTISGTDCVYTVTCAAGYVYDAEIDFCVTPGYGCPFPDLDYPTGPEACVSDGFCQPQSDGYFIVGTECIYEPPTSG